MSESGNPKSATLILLVMAGLWVVLLITMRAGITIPSPLSEGGPGHSTPARVESADKAPSMKSGSAAEAEISADEYQVMEQMLRDYPRMTTLFEAAMVDGKITYQEAENLLARKEAMQREAAAGALDRARERLKKAIEESRKQ
ncbi:MAG: hypothetical protein Kow006_23220 [Gammaproteobacteria bacterium]